MNTSEVSSFTSKRDSLGGFYKFDVPNPLMEYMHKPIFILTLCFLGVVSIVLLIVTLSGEALDPTTDCRLLILTLLSGYFTCACFIVEYTFAREETVDILKNKQKSERSRVFLACGVFANILLSIYILVVLSLAYQIGVVLAILIFYLYAGSGLVLFYTGPAEKFLHIWLIFIGLLAVLLGFIYLLTNNLPSK